LVTVDKQIDAVVDLYKSGNISEAQRQGELLLGEVFGKPTLHNIMGIIYRNRSQFQKALAEYNKAIELVPTFAVFYVNKANTLNELGRHEDAVESCLKAIELDACNASAYASLGWAQYNLGDLECSIVSYDKTIEINPSFAKAYYNRARVLKQSGRLAEAFESYKAGGNLDPIYKLDANFLLPIIPLSNEMIASYRKKFLRAVGELSLMEEKLKVPFETFSFFLAYHNEDNYSLMIALAGMFRKRIPQLNYTSSHINDWSLDNRSDPRIKVGILSSLFNDHTIGHLNIGFIKHLDRSKFKVTVIHIPGKALDNYSQKINELADDVIILPSELVEQQDILADRQFDILFYPDIGMSGPTYYLAFARLAPVQVVSWGHPDTTGLDTIDYFVSAGTIEPSMAEKYYSEKLVQLSRLPCYYIPPSTPIVSFSRDAYHIPDAAKLYGCPQSLFKFHPDFDDVLIEILETDPTAKIILIEGRLKQTQELLQLRWRKKSALLLERVIFLPQMSRGEFLGMLSAMDVLLDPLYFGSGNTLYEAMFVGVPVATWPGKFMRSRIVSGAYKQMQIHDAPVAQTVQDYARVAVSFATNRERRSAFCDAVRKNSTQLFEDKQAVKELEDFFAAAIKAV